MQTLKKLLLLWCVLGSLGIVSAADGAGRGETKRILLLISYDLGQEWSAGIKRGLESTFKTLPFRIDLECLELDSMRTRDPERWRTRFDECRDRIRKGDYDLVVVADNDATDLLFEHHAEIPARLPILFCGYEGDPELLRRKHANTTGLLQQMDISRTLEFGLRLMPRTEEVAIITDGTPEGRREDARLRELFENRAEPPVLSFINGAQYNTSQMLDRISKLPRNSFVILAPWRTMSRDGYRSERTLGMDIEQHTPGPFMIVTSTLLTDAALGGFMTDSETHGREAGRLARQVFAAGGAAAVPIQTGAVSPVFDYAALKSWKLDPEVLPPDTRFINQPPGYYEAFPEIFWGTVIGGIVILLFLAGLAIYIVRYRGVVRRSLEVLQTLPIHFFVVSAGERLLVKYCGAGSNSVADFSDAQTLADVSGADYSRIAGLVSEVLADGRMRQADFNSRGTVYSSVFTRLPRGFFGEEAVLWASQDTRALQNSRMENSLLAERLNLTLHAIGDAVITTDAEERITMMNPSAVRLTGFSQQEALGRQLDEVFRIVSYLDERKVESPVHKALATGMVMELANHTDLIARDGKRSHIADSAAPIRDSAGEIIGAILVFRDVTEEYDSRDRLKLNHDLLQKSAALAHIEYFHRDLQNNVSLLSCEHFWPQVDGKPIPARGWVLDEDLERFGEEWKKLLQGGSTSLQITYRTCEQGKIRYYAMCAMVRDHGEGTQLPLQVFGMIQDVSELEIAMHNYHDINGLLNVMLEQIPNPVLVKDIDDDFRYVVANRSFAGFLNLEPEQVIGKTDFELFPNRRDAEHFRADDLALLEKGGPLRLEDHFFDSDHQEHDVLTNKSLVHRSDGRRLLVAIGTDISALKKLEREREKMIENQNNYIEYERITNHCLRNITLETDLAVSVNRMLQEIGETIEADRCAIFRYDEESGHAFDTYEWTAAGIESQVLVRDDVDMRQFPGLLRTLENHADLAIADLDNPPDGMAHFVSVVRSHGIRSVLITGIWVGTRLWGFIGVDFISRSRHFTECDIRIMHNAVNLFLIAMERDRQINMLADNMSLQKQVFDHISIPIVLLDLDMNIIMVNSAVHRFAGPDETLHCTGKCYVEFCNRETPPADCPVRVVLDTGAAYSVERIVRGRRLRVSAQPIFDRDGRMIHILESAVDISALYEQKEALEQGNRLMHAYLEQDKTVNDCLEAVVLNFDYRSTLRHILARIGKELRIDACSVFCFEPGNQVLRSIEKWSAVDENAGGDQLSVVDIERFPASFRTLTERGELMIDLGNGTDDSPELLEFRPYMMANQLRVCFFAGIRYQGRFWGHIGLECGDREKAFGEVERRLMFAAVRVIEVLLEREESRRLLDRSENEKSRIWELMTVPMVLLDADRNIVRVNPAAERLAEYSSAEILAQPCFKSFCRCGKIPENCPFEATKRAGRALQIDFVLRNREFQVVTLPVFENGVLTNILLSYIDMTENNENKRQLLTAIDAAKAADRAKSTFLATMSHEIRTPLNAVIGFSELLKNGALEPEEQQEYLQSINLAGNALLNLINDVLDLSKIEAEQISIQPEKMDFAALCREIVSIFRLRAAEKDLQLILECPEGLPLLCLDSLRLRQVLLNLTGNAIKFTNFGQVVITVDFQAENAQCGTLTLRVSDTGIGIPPEFQMRVFEPFAQHGDFRGNRSYQGTGLGLTITRHLVERMGGVVRLDSRDGEGSCFTVVLRNVRFFCVEASPESSPVPLSEATVIPADMRALLVDDVSMNLKVLGAMLKKLELPFVCAASGAEALGRLESEHFELIFTDMWMPGMNGAELAGRIRSLYGSRPSAIVALTADTEMANNFELDDFDAILFKPVTLEKLEKTIKLQAAGKLYRNGAPPLKI